MKTAAIVAAAGLSTRMGQPKQLLPWGSRTVVETVVKGLTDAGADPVIVVTGRETDLILMKLIDTSAMVVHNPAYAENETLLSYQVGIRHLVNDSEVNGALLSLCDQPQISVDVIRSIVDVAKLQPDSIVIPSHNMHRGHPIYLPASLWEQALSLDETHTLRDLIHQNDDQIRYVLVDSASILQDIDTPDDYEALRPS